MLLSNNDIKREIVKAKNISIYPLKLENIKGSSLNLSASKMAWRVSDRKSAVVADTTIIIPPRDTVCIYTNEAIWVSRRVGGTYHPRVSLVSKGLGHISTTLDPGWAGVSLVAVNNPSDKEIVINVGEAFVSVMFYYLKTPSSLNDHENLASRPDIGKVFDLSPEEHSFLEMSWHRNQSNITKNMIKSLEYNDLKSQKLKFRRTLTTITSSPLFSTIFGGIITGAIIYFLGFN
ncbi:dCTP deaminase domain-containing protein [Exiguobacterium mexicanum]|uniref:dCTP deaminase domain-containing protein n=1 Tax=Exiguobacterium mexicanum TaxID=340146 RepID=UPI00110EBAA1|nr:hypothetical protein [Exiguobacterium mexicanum]